MDLLKWIAPKYGLVLAVNRDNASIIRSLHDPDGRTISAITEVILITCHKDILSFHKQ